MSAHPNRLSTIILLIPLVLLVQAQGLSRAESRIELREGDEVYACGCGKECGCGTLSRVANRCACGRELVKSRVVRIEGEHAILVVDRREKVFRTAGRYGCGCMKDCGCGTISQRPGKCACGRILLPLDRK